eukprot:426797-Rhodomonas_salina.2
MSGSGFTVWGLGFRSQVCSLHACCDPHDAIKYTLVADSLRFTVPLHGFRFASLRTPNQELAWPRALYRKESFSLVSASGHPERGFGDAVSGSARVACPAYAISVPDSA